MHFYAFPALYCTSKNQLSFDLTFTGYRSYIASSNKWVKDNVRKNLKKEAVRERLVS